MRNARVIRTTKKNSGSDKISLQKSDIIDFIEGNIRLLVVHNQGDNITDGDMYEGERLNKLMASALANGQLRNKDTKEIFYLANRD